MSIVTAHFGSYLGTYGDEFACPDAASDAFAGFVTGWLCS